MNEDELLAIQEAEDFDWSVFDELEDPRPDYNNSGALDVHLYSTDHEVKEAARFFCAEIGYSFDKAIIHMKVMLLNLYWTHHLSPDRWVGLSLSNNRYGIPGRYNPQRIEVHPLKQVLVGLIRGRYIVRRKGFFNRALKSGRCTRVKATKKLIDLLIDRFSFTVDMVGRHPYEEVIILKDTKENNKKLIDYDDTRYTISKRKFINEYNAFLQQTNIDIDYIDYVHRKKLRNCSPEYLIQLPMQLNFDLTKRKMRRVFNNGSFTQGGRFYSSFWMEMPSKLRLRIILNCQKVIEADYSGIHIHLLYNKIGIDYGVKQEDPYKIPGYPATKEYRNLFKKLLLAAVNAKDDEKRTGETKAIMALRESINFNVNDYPAEIPDLHKVIKDFKRHHAPIARFLFTGEGYWLMYQDSQIAELVLKEMYEHKIPVLPVHDSFICPKQYSDMLIATMEKAYRTVAGNKLTTTPYTVNIKKPDEWNMAENNPDPDIKDEDYYFDITLTKDQTLVEHILQIDGDALFDDEAKDDSLPVGPKVIAPHVLYTSVPIKYE